MIDNIISGHCTCTYCWVLWGLKQSHAPVSTDKGKKPKPSLSLLGWTKESINLKLNICELCHLIYQICFCKNWHNVVVPFKFIFNIWICCFHSSLEEIGCQQPIRGDFLKQKPWCPTKLIINLIFNLFCLQMQLSHSMLHVLFPCFCPYL